MRLWLIRHAKSSWADARLRDFDRPLNGRGRRDGPVVQRWLARQAFAPAWIWTSPAERTRATAEFVHGAFPGAELTADQRLYGATPEAMLEVIRETPPGIESVALVAHNPGTTQCINLLAGERVIDNLPTFGVARLHWFGGLEDLSFGRAILETLIAPRLLPAD